MSDKVYLRALAELCHSSGRGAQWSSIDDAHAASATVRPSSGFLAAVFALHACRNVSLFGLRAAGPCAPHHYYDEPPRRCREGQGVGAREVVPRRYDNPFHNFEMEHDIYTRSFAKRVRGVTLNVY